ncbi:InlB B-repeat-containing protein, partial [Bacteroides sp.]|uniref:InlB B-repeat-containing protein n=1 Tax=Bacteroides sp. TaxID=29523 RepID=UPI003A917214
MKYILSLFIALWSIAAWGQEGGDGFNPSNPGEPGQRYNLTVNVTPDGAGSTSPSGKQQYALGESVYLSANANNYYQFVGWAQDGDTISRSRSFNYTMPAKNTTITAVFKATDSFNPDNPDDPSQEVIKYKLMLTPSPVEGGRFNITSGERFSEGTSISVYAYPNSNYQFEGWKQGETLLSTESPYSFVMGKEDVSITGLFRFNPDSPGNPGANHWNAETGELIIDDFTPGSIMNALSNIVGGSSNYSKVLMVIVSGQMNNYDFGIAQNLSNCTLLDLSRTGGYTEIPSYAFDGTNLSTIILPAGIERIGNYAFRNCKNLTDITCYAITPPTVSNYTFEGIADGAVVHVLASAIPLYTEAPVWKDLTILPLTEDVKTLEVNLPADSEGTYKNMTLELQNLQNGQKQRYVVSDRTSYTFNGLLKNCTYNVSLKTPTGVVLGQIENIEIKDENRSVTFTSLLALIDVNLQVLTPDGTDVTSQVQITWLDSKQTYLSQGNLLKAQTAGTEIGYRMVLNQDLGMQYIAPENQVYSVKEKENRLVYTLTPIETVTVSGIVKEAGDSVLSGATVSVSQKLNGKYSKSFIAQTDAKGKFELQVYNDESTISVSATDYISQTLTKADFSKGTDLGTIELKTIAGATINLSLTYTPSVVAGTEATTEDWYSDYANIVYTIYNETQQKEITDFSVQYLSIVLLEEVAAGDRLRITASSKNNAFQPVTATAMINENADKASALLKIIAWGGINASYTTTDNTGVVGILYDSKGELVKKYTYSNQSLSINDLSDGDYTLVSMANSTFFNSILKLSQLAASGLTEGTDYVQNTVTVKSGILSSIANSHIPALDDSKLYYTGSNTSFTVNKASIVAGNYLTLKGKVDFKEEYAGSVSNVQLVVDLPESCSYVENSAMAGNSIASYTLDNNRLTIPLANYTDLVRFCVIPTAGGSYQPNAFVEFTLNGKEVSQPIGSAFYEVKDLSISVPKTVAKTTVPISGTAQGNSEVEIYDNDILIGQTKTLATGVWITTCELNEPYNLSTHSIYAKVTTKQGMHLQSETHECRYDMNAIEAQTVTMTFYNGWLKQNVEVVFDFQKGTTSASSYMFYTATDITFIIDLTNNDPEVVSDVTLWVYTDQNEIRELNAIYDEKKNKWIATSRFDSSNLPVNLSVDLNAQTQLTADRDMLMAGFDDMTNSLKSSLQQKQVADSIFIRDYIFSEEVLFDDLENVLSQDSCDVAALDSLLSQIIEDKNDTTDYNLEEIQIALQQLNQAYTSQGKQLQDSLDRITEMFYLDDPNEFILPTEDSQYTIQVHGGNKIITRKSISTIDIDSLCKNGFRVMNMTDNSNILYKVDQNGYTFIDTELQLMYELSFSELTRVLTRIENASKVCALSVAKHINSIKDLATKLYDSNYKDPDVIKEVIKTLVSLMSELECFYSESINKINDEVDDFYKNVQKELGKTNKGYKAEEKKL